MHVREKLVGQEAMIIRHSSFEPASTVWHARNTCLHLLVPFYSLYTHLHLSSATPCVCATASITSFMRIFSLTHSSLTLIPVLFCSCVLILWSILVPVWVVYVLCIISIHLIHSSTHFVTCVCVFVVWHIFLPVRLCLYVYVCDI